MGSSRHDVGKSGHHAVLGFTRVIHTRLISPKRSFSAIKIPLRRPRVGDVESIGGNAALRVP